MTCLYCPNPADSLEHPLPAGFGEFQDAPLLPRRICTDCNNKRLGRLDEQLLRCGPEGLLRRLYGIEGRSSHGPVNPFYRGSSGGNAIQLTAFDDQVGLPVLFELENRVYRQARQVIFVANDEVHHIPLREGTTPEYLRRFHDELRIPPDAEIHLIYGDGEEWVDDIAGQAFPNRTRGKAAPMATTYTGAVATVRLTNRYFRAIAKTGFHYFLTQLPQYTGHEPMFQEIRDFILDETANVARANVFIGRRQHALLGEMLPPGARPDGWIAHIVAAETEPGAAAAHVQLFLSADWPAPTYTVRVAHHPSIAERRAAGHAYVYYPDGPQGRFAGKARPLGTSRERLAVRPLVPVVTKPSPPAKIT